MLYPLSYEGWWVSQYATGPSGRHDHWTVMANSPVHEVRVVGADHTLAPTTSGPRGPRT